MTLQFTCLQFSSVQFIYLLLQKFQAAKLSDHTKICMLKLLDVCKIKKYRDYLNSSYSYSTFSHRVKYSLLPSGLSSINTIVSSLNPHVSPCFIWKEKFTYLIEGVVVQWCDPLGRYHI